jgi:thymidine kinase
MSTSSSSSSCAMISNCNNATRSANNSRTMRARRMVRRRFESSSLSSSSSSRCFASQAVFDEENLATSSSSSSSSVNNSSVAGREQQQQQQNIIRENDETEAQKGVGSVHLILGPMFAGKTTRLLERVKQLEESVNANVLLLKSDKDTRYAKDKVVTHDGRGRECFPVKSLELAVVVETVGVEKWNECDVVAVDEAQFLTNLYEFCRVAADEHDKIVLVAGLNGDFKRETFGEVQETLPLCDSVTKLTAKCKCGRPALFSKRIVNVGDGQELVGGADKYLPACRRCFLN